MRTHSREVAAHHDAGFREHVTSVLARKRHGVDDALDHGARTIQGRRMLADALVIDFSPAQGGGQKRCRVLRPRADLWALILRAMHGDTRRPGKSADGVAECSAVPLDTLEWLATFLDLRESFATPRTRADASCAWTAHFAGWTLDLVKRLLRAPSGAVVHVPGAEFALLMAFLAHPRQVLSRDQLVAQMRATTRFGSHRTLDVYVST